MPPRRRCRTPAPRCGAGAGQRAEPGGRAGQRHLGIPPSGTGCPSRPARREFRGSHHGRVAALVPLPGGEAGDRVRWCAGDDLAGDPVMQGVSGSALAVEIRES